MELLEIAENIFYIFASIALIVFIISTIIAVKLQYKKFKLLEKEMEDKNVKHN